MNAEILSEDAWSRSYSWHWLTLVVGCMLFVCVASLLPIVLGLMSVEYLAALLVVIVSVGGLGIFVIPEPRLSYQGYLLLFSAEELEDALNQPGRSWESKQVLLHALHQVRAKGCVH